MQRPDCVVLLHGLGRTAGSMQKIEKALVADGYLVWNESYRSRTAEIEQLVEQTIPKAIEYCRQREPGRVHFVTHSMGGILLRQYLGDNTPENLGRIVMLSPPNSGSEVVDILKDKVFFSWVLGPAGRQLGAEEESVVRKLGAISAKVGIVTGNVSSDPWFSGLIPGEDDGKVSVDSARLEGMADFLVVPYGHTRIMRQPEVIDQVRYFLINSRFQR